MRVGTWNVNGMRAALRKGFAEHLEAVAPDVLLLQEVRALPEQLPVAWRAPEGWHVTWHPAEKKGYSGVAIWTREPHHVVAHGLGGPDEEGRVLTVEVGDLTVVSVYLPSGSSGEHRQAIKDAWMPTFQQWARRWLDSPKPVIMGGDFNIAHTENDIHNPRGNKKSSGFLPHEREWFGELLAEGWHDVQREQAGEVKGPYSWWSNRGRARELDRGWRIDYLLANDAAHKAWSGEATTRRASGLTVSDHAIVHADFEL
ncbi:MAG: exodeoxyribonuclease III [Myxococcota bacterium]